MVISQLPLLALFCLFAVHRDVAGPFGTKHFCRCSADNVDSYFGLFFAFAPDLEVN